MIIAVEGDESNAQLAVERTISSQDESNVKDMLEILIRKVDCMNTEMISLRVVVERLEKLFRQQNKTKETDDKRCKQIEYGDDSRLLEKYEFPIDTIEELKKFNSTIENNEKYRLLLIEHFGKICGADGMQKGEKIYAKLISEIMLTKQLLTLTSWTGVSRTASVEEKLSFKSLTGVIDVIDTVLTNADSRWKKSDTDGVLREKILKHANKRNAAVLKKNIKDDKKEHCNSNSQVTEDASITDSVKKKNISANKRSADVHQKNTKKVRKQNCNTEVTEAASVTDPVEKEAVCANKRSATALENDTQVAEKENRNTNAEVTEDVNITDSVHTE